MCCLHGEKPRVKPKNQTFLFGAVNLDDERAWVAQDEGNCHLEEVLCTFQVINQILVKTLLGAAFQCEHNPAGFELNAYNPVPAFL